MMRACAISRVNFRPRYFIRLLATFRARVGAMARCRTSCSLGPKDMPPCRPRILRLKATPVDNLNPFGQVIVPHPDGTPTPMARPSVARMLELSRGIPRFYLMRLKNRNVAIRSNDTSCAHEAVLKELYMVYRGISEWVSPPYHHWSYGEGGS